MKKGKTRLLSLLLCFVLVLSMCSLGLAACSDDNKVSTGPFDKSSITMELGRTSNIKYNGKGSISWSITDESIASFTTTLGGKVCALKGESVGKTTLTATYDGGKKRDFKVTVTERNVITVKADGAAITSLEVEAGKTKALTASTNLGTKNFTWSSSNEEVAKVSSKGVVTGVFAGKATITVKAKNDQETYLEIPVTVKAKEGTTAYMLLMGAEDGTQAWVESEGGYVGDEIKEDTFFEWHTRGNWGQTVTFKKTPRYNDGVISFNYESNWNPGLWTGMQVFYKNSKHTAGNTYKLHCKINIKSASLINQETLADEPLSKVKVTLNENVIELNKGMNEVEVYYVYNAPLGQGGTSSFDLQMGWADPSHTNGWFVQNADVEISDISWVEDNPVKLETPSFTYANNVVTVDDPNTVGVAEYLAIFYDNENKVVGTSTFKNGENFNDDPIGVGQYTIKIRALGINKHYQDSEISESSTPYTDTTPAKYTMTKNGAIEEALDRPGTWSYFGQWYVSVKTAKHDDGVTTLEFSNNDGEFDTLQLYYKNADLTKNTNYKLTVDIELLGDDDGGYITLNGNEIYLLPERHTYNVGYTETDASFAMLVAIYEQNESGTHQITSGTINVSNPEWTPISSPTPLSAPSAPTVAVEKNEATVTINADVTGAYKGYEIGLFSSATAPTPAMTAKVKPSDVIVSITKEKDEEGNETGEKIITRKAEIAVNLDYLATGNYIVKVRAKGDGILYAADSAWGAASESFSYENPSGEVYMLPTNTGDTVSTLIPGTWTYFAQSWVTNNGTNVPLSPIHKDGKVTASFENNTGRFDSLQFYYDDPNAVVGNTYTVKMTLTVENAKITNDGSRGDNDYVWKDHVDESLTDFRVIVSGKQYSLETGTHTYTFELKKNSANEQLFVILFSEWADPDGSPTQFHRLVAADLTIEDLVITAK